jgi:transposase
MKRTRDGRRRFSQEFKIAAVKRVLGGEALGQVARDLGLSFELLWRWRKRVSEKGEDQLFDIGRQKGQPRDSAEAVEASQQRRIAELEQLVGRQQMEIRFLDKALRQVEAQRHRKKDGGGAASSNP